MRAGAARLEITPERDGLWLAGHGRPRRFSGVRDPLWVRTLYLEGGDFSAALSCLDLVGLRKVHVDQVRRRAAAILPPDRLLLFATHTHDAPDTIGYWGPRLWGVIPRGSGLDPDYLDQVEERTVESLRQAKANAVPVEVDAACAEVPAELTRNVRRPRFKEDNVYVLRFRDPGGRTVAVLSNYPCHPEMLGASNRRISAEFPGELHRVVEAGLGGVSIFFQHALGGLVTGAGLPEGRPPPPEEAEALLVRLGTTLGQKIVEALERGGDPVDLGLGLRLARRTFTVPLKNRRLYRAARFGLIPVSREELEARLLRTETSLLELGPVRMVTVPGEPLPEVGFQIQAILNCRYPFVLSLGCDQLGYLVPRRYAGLRKYRYENAMSVGPETVDRLLEEIRWMAWKGPRDHT